VDLQHRPKTDFLFLFFFLDALVLVRDHVIDGADLFVLCQLITVVTTACSSDQP